MSVTVLQREVDQIADMFYHGQKRYPPSVYERARRILRRCGLTDDLVEQVVAGRRVLLPPVSDDDDA